MSRRPLTGSNNTVVITNEVGDQYEGRLLGVRMVQFGAGRDGKQDNRFIADFEAPGMPYADKEGNWSAWLPTQLRTLLVNVDTGELRVKRGAYLWLTYTGTQKTKSGGQPTHIFAVEIDDGETA